MTDLLNTIQDLHNILNHILDWGFYTHVATTPFGILANSLVSAEVGWWLRGRAERNRCAEVLLRSSLHEYGLYLEREASKIPELPRSRPSGRPAPGHHWTLREDDHRDAGRRAKRADVVTPEPPPDQQEEG